MSKAKTKPTKQSKRKSDKSKQSKPKTSTKTKPKNKPLSIKQKKYVKYIMKGMSRKQAALKAGYSENTAIAPGKNLEKPSVKEEMRKALIKAGLTTTKFAEHINEGMYEANKMMGAGDNYVEIPDYATRHRYLETGLRLSGLGNETNIDINVDNRKLYVNLPKEK